MNEYSKCRFCKCNDEHYGCGAIFWNWSGYEPDTNQLIEKAKEKEISVTYVITLIDLESR